MSEQGIRFVGHDHRDGENRSGRDLAAPMRNLCRTMDPAITIDNRSANPEPRGGSLSLLPASARLSTNSRRLYRYAIAGPRRASGHIASEGYAGCRDVLLGARADVAGGGAAARRGN